VAVVRAVLHAEGRIDDPYAAGMLARRWRRLLPIARYLAPRSFFASLEARTRWFDDEVVGSLDAGIDTVVTIGAGYDARPWRFARPGARFAEVDHPATQADKRRRAPLDGGGPTYVPLDLSGAGVAAALQDRPALYVVEGLTMYLTADEVRRLLTDLATAPDGSRLAVNFAVPPSDSSYLRLVRAVGRWRGEPHLFHARRDEAVALVEACGWTVDRVPDGSVVAVGARLGEHA